jgi:RNA polymerase sigma-70 factor (family 1)
VKPISIDSKYIQQLIAGNESAFKMVYDLYSENVYRLAFRFLKDKEQSEEIVQETFINLWLSRDKLDMNGNLWLYLFVIAKRLSLNALRQICKSTELSEALLINVLQIQNTTEEDVVVRDLGRYVDTLIDKLPKQQRIVFKLSRIDGLSYKEIAQQQNISPNTVKNHMVEALKTLRAHLKYAHIIYFFFLFYRS